MNATIIEMVRAVILTAGMVYVLLILRQNVRDYRLLRRARHATHRAWVNMVNAAIRTAGMFLMWSVAMLALWFESPWPTGWATFAQVSYTIVGIGMVLIVRNIRKAQEE